MGRQRPVSALRSLPPGTQAALVKLAIGNAIRQGYPGDARVRQATATLGEIATRVMTDDDPALHRQFLTLQTEVDNAIRRRRSFGEIHRMIVRCNAA